MNRSKAIVVGVIALVVIVAGLAIAKSNNKSKPAAKAPATQSTKQAETNSTSTQTATPGTATTTTPAASQTVTVEAGSFYFKPNQITVKKGQKVKLVLNSVSSVHNLVIDDLSVAVPNTSGGSSNSVEFTPTTAGTFDFYCSISNHRQMGMTGKLTVE